MANRIREALRQSMVVLQSIATMYALYAGSLFLLQREMLYPGQGFPVPAEARLPDPRSEQVWLDTADGRVEAWLLLPVAGGPGPHPALVVAHGNGEVIDDMPDQFRVPREAGWAVMLVEYPGFGRSAGRPGQDSITAAMTAAWDVLAARPDIDPERIAGFGRSLGGGAVCALAAERRLSALVLQSTFTSVRSFSRRYLVPGFLVRDPFDNLEIVRNFSGPLRIYHGRRDEVIDYRHGVKLAEAAGIELVTMECGHNDCPTAGTGFWRPLLDFLQANETAPGGKAGAR